LLKIFLTEDEVLMG